MLPSVGALLSCSVCCSSEFIAAGVVADWQDSPCTLHSAPGAEQPEPPAPWQVAVPTRDSAPLLQE